MKNGSQLPLNRCPHCSVAQPRLQHQWNGQSNDFTNRNPRQWFLYSCSSCGGMVLTVAAIGQHAEITSMWPTAYSASDALPARVREFLTQAINSLHAPAGAIMLTASAVDAMLKDKNFKDGSLKARIDEAAAAHLITSEMAAWGHEIRLDANDQRHADESVELPNAADAAKAIEFAKALAQFLYVLPAQVQRGRGA